MKKIAMSIAAAGLFCSVNGADLVNKDETFLFGQEEVNVAMMADVEMAQTDGKVLEILEPVTGLVGGLPVVGSVANILPTDLLSLDALPTDGLLDGDLLALDGLPLAGGVPMSTDIMGGLLSAAAGLPLVGEFIGGLPIQAFTPDALFRMSGGLPFMGSMLINSMVIDPANNILPVHLTHINLTRDLPIVGNLLGGNLLGGDLLGGGLLSGDLLGGGLPLVGALPTNLLSLNSLPLTGMLGGGLPLPTDALGPVLSLVDTLPVGSVLP
jgi:hypothetical protein